MSIFVTGDTHSKLNKLISKETKQLIQNGDYLIICGDFGHIWYGREDKKNYNKQRKRLKILSELNYTILFIDGNHENFNELYKYPKIKYNGGIAHKISDNIYHLCRGQVFELDGLKFFTFGGAESTDKQFRKEYKTWWKEEYPTYQEFMTGQYNLEYNNNEVDYIITHDCGYSLLINTFDYRIPLKNYTLNKYIDNVLECCKYKKHFFGHHHVDDDYIKTNYNSIPVYDKVIKISD